MIEKFKKSMDSTFKFFILVILLVFLYLFSGFNRYQHFHIGEQSAFLDTRTGAVRVLILQENNVWLNISPNGKKEWVKTKEKS